MKRLAVLLLIATPCVAQNSKLTPGVVRPLTTAQVCKIAWGKDQRHVTQKMLLEMCSRYGMPWHCWGSGDNKVPIVNLSTHDILAMGNRLQMRWINTIGISTQMVQLQAWWDGTAQNDPEQYMGTNTFELVSFHAKSGSPITTRLHPFAKPQPATSGGMFLNPTEYSFLNRSGKESRTSVATSTRAESLYSLIGPKYFGTNFTLSWWDSIGIMFRKTSVIAKSLVLFPVAINKLSATSFADQVERHTTNFTKEDNPCKDGCEGDHLIPRELAGADDIRNLWPQPYEPRPGAHEKDRLENFLHKQVCAGKISLKAAQDIFRNDWYAYYKENIK